METLKVNEGYDLQSYPQLNSDEACVKFCNSEVERIKNLKYHSGHQVDVSSVDNVEFKWCEDDDIFRLTADVTFEYVD